MKKNLHRVVRLVYDGNAGAVIKDRLLGTSLGSKVHAAFAGRPYEEDIDKRNMA